MYTSPLKKREFLSIVFKEHRIVLITFFGLFALVLGLSFLSPPKYEANAELLIKSGREFQSRPDPGQSAAVEPYLTKQEIMNSELEILSSNDLIEETIGRVGLNKLYPALANQGASGPRPIDEAIQQFKKALKTDTAMMSEVITVSFLNQNRDVAIEALNDLLQIYQEKHTTLYSDNRPEFLEQKTKDYQDQLDAVTKRITALRQSQKIYDVAAQRAQLIQDRSVVAETLRSLETRALDQHGREDFYTQRLKELSPFSIKEESGTGEKKLSVATVHDWKKQDPAYVDPVYDDAVLKLQTAQADASALDQQIALQKATLDNMDARQKSMEEVARTLESLEREHDTLDGLVRTSRASYEQAMTNEQLDRQKFVSVDVFEKPNASTIPTKPRRLLYALVGMILGTLGSGAILVYALVFRQTLISAESVERMLGLKVLATLPERS
ncbi:MAG: Wzz/FepE/Etk N-terminal domain-containing protein [Alphaproteobacteria bacterium]|nr:Wzz/FepE/Etk N-terminal domain-containing protein [Alphaproteobacteria bacterium]